MARRILILAQVICIFGVTVWFHDDGLPDSLSEADQTYVLQQSQLAENRMRDVVDGMRRFVAEPDRESETADSLVDAVNSWVEINNEMIEDPRFFTEFDSIRNRNQQDRFAEVEKELNSATDEMVEELWARKERGEYDQEAYDRLKMAFEKTSWNWTELPDGVCDKRKCIWCFFQRVLLK